IDTEEDMRRIVAWMNGQKRRVLPALLLAVVHLVDGQPLAVQLVIVQRRGDASDGRKELGMLERQPQRSLSAPADAGQANTRRREVPARLEGRQDRVKEIALRSDLWIELGANTIRPPGSLAVRADTGEAQLVEDGREGSVAG